jgi:hypothetical protein
VVSINTTDNSLNRSRRRSRPQDLVHPVAGQPPLDRADGGDPSEHRATPNFCAPQPGLQRANRTGLLSAHARQGDIHPLPGLVGLRARDAHDQALFFEAKVGDIDADQLRAPEGANEINQKQRRVAQAREIARADGDQPLDVRRDQCRRRPHRPVMLADDAGQRLPDRRMP